MALALWQRLISGRDWVTGPTQGQAGYKNAKMREKKRHNAAIKMICDHILDERLKDMIKDQCTSTRKGTEAWALILSECSEEPTDLHVLDEKKKFADLTIEKDVGYDVESITGLTRRMHQINGKLAAADKYSDDELAVKLLCCIVHPEALATEAVKELSAKAGERQFELTVNGTQKRDYAKIKAYLDKQWRALVKQGIIRPRAAGKRLDSGVLQVTDDARLCAFNRCKPGYRGSKLAPASGGR